MSAIITINNIIIILVCAFENEIKIYEYTVYLKFEYISREVIKAPVSASDFKKESRKKILPGVPLTFCIMNYIINSF